MRYSEVKAIIQSLRERGYKRRYGTIYMKQLRYGSLGSSVVITIEKAYYYPGGPERFLDLTYADAMDELARVETQQRLGGN
jgi:hypothetical protein